MSTEPSVAVVGPGAIGTTLAAALHEVGRTPTLCGHTPRERLELRTEEGAVVVPGPVRTHAREIRSPVDVVFLAVKSTQVEAAAPWLAPLTHPGSVVCVLQNGVEQSALVEAHVPGCRVLPSVVWFSAEAQLDGSVWLRSAPHLTLPDTATASMVLNALQGTRCSVELAKDFTTAAWRKLLQNAVAGLMVLTGRRAGVFARHDIESLASAYLNECLQVARAEGAELGDEVPGQILNGLRTSPPYSGSSILADRERDRPLEWSTRNGIVLRRGLAHGIPTPISDLVVPLLAAASDGPG